MKVFQTYSIGLILILSFSMSGMAQDTTKTKKPKIKFSDIVRVNGYIKNLNIL